MNYFHPPERGNAWTHLLKDVGCEHNIMIEPLYASLSQLSGDCHFTGKAKL